MIIVQGHDTDADVTAVSFSADGRLLASSGADGFVKVWEVAQLAGGVPLWTDQPSEGEVNHLQFSPDGRLLFACGDDGVARAWPAAGGKREELGQGPGTPMPHAWVLVCSTDGRFVAWACGFRTTHPRIVIARVADRSFHRRFRGHENMIGILAAGPDGLVSGSADRRIRFWDWRTGRRYHELILRGYVRTLAVSRAGDWLAASCAGIIYVWPLEQRTARGRRLPGRARELRGHARLTMYLDFSPDGTRLASASEDGTLRLWDVNTATEARVFDPKLGPLHHVAFAPDGLTLAFSSEKGHVGLLDIDD